MLDMEKYKNNFNSIKQLINSINLLHLSLGIIIFGIWLGIMTNFSDKLRIMISYDDHDPMCIGMDGWKIPLEDCYWDEN